MTQSQDLRRRIAEVDGGEITFPSRIYPYEVIGPLAKSQSILYTTKRHAIWRMVDKGNISPNIGIVARYGLPADDDLDWINRIANGRQLYFLGDCDPFDLLVFTFISIGCSISYLGVSDDVLSQLGVEIDNRATITLAGDEASALELLAEVNPQFTAMVGSNCASMLNNGKKLEIEAVVSFATHPFSQFFAMLP